IVLPNVEVGLHQIAAARKGGSLKARRYRPAGKFNHSRNDNIHNDECKYRNCLKEANPGASFVGQEHNRECSSAARSIQSTSRESQRTLCGKNYKQRGKEKLKGGRSLVVEHPKQCQERGETQNSGYLVGPESAARP